jgi:hypothetical protein
MTDSSSLEIDTDSICEKEAENQNGCYSKGCHSCPEVYRENLQQESKKTLDSPVSSTGQAKSNPE